jgi:quinol monooxygenase YgiN
MPFDEPRWMGSIGMIGTKAVYNAIMHCDLLLMLGTDYPSGRSLCHRQGQGSGNRGHRAIDHHVNGHHGGKNVMSKFANVVTIEVAPGRRDQVVTLLLAHKARLNDEPGTLQFEVLLPKDDDTKVRVYEMYRDAAAFEVHLNGPSLAQWKKETAGMVVKLQGVRCAVVD